MTFYTKSLVCKVFHYFAMISEYIKTVSRYIIIMSRYTELFFHKVSDYLEIISQYLDTTPLLHYYIIIILRCVPYFVKMYLFSNSGTNNRLYVRETRRLKS